MCPLLPVAVWEEGSQVSTQKIFKENWDKRVTAKWSWRADVPDVQHHYFLNSCYESHIFHHLWFWIESLHMCLKWTYLNDFNKSIKLFNLCLLPRTYPQSPDVLYSQFTMYTWILNICSMLMLLNESNLLSLIPYHL